MQDKSTIPLSKNGGMSQTIIPNTTRMQLLEPPNLIGSNIAETFKTAFRYGQTNSQDYYVYSNNSGRRSGEEF